MEGQKERQGDFVFTAKDQGEYRFCFDNGISTFAEKMVDFEIAVRATLPLRSHDPWRVDCVDVYANSSASQRGSADIQVISAGRERVPRRPTSQQTRQLPRADISARGIHPQSIPRPINDQSESEILPYARKPEYEHSEEHGGSNIQFQRGRERFDDRNGRAAGVHRPILFPRCKKRCVNITQSHLLRNTLMNENRICMKL